MAEDLIEKELLIGKTRYDIIMFLGRTGLSEHISNDRLMEIMVGNDIIDSLYLCIDFDEEGRAINAYIGQG